MPLRRSVSRRRNISTGGRKSKKKSKSKSKRPLNAFMKKLCEARKQGKTSFEYNGKTYCAKKTKTGMIVYKAKGGAMGGSACKSCLHDMVGGTFSRSYSEY